LTDLIVAHSENSTIGRKARQPCLHVDATLVI